MVRLLRQTHNKDGYSTNYSPQFSPNSSSPYSNGVDEMTYPSKSPLSCISLENQIATVAHSSSQLKLYRESFKRSLALKTLAKTRPSLTGSQFFSLETFWGASKTQLSGCVVYLYAFSKTDLLRLLSYLVLKLTNVESQGVKTINIIVIIFLRLTVTV